MPTHKISIQSLYVAAGHAGWLDLGRVKTTDSATKKHILCSQEVLDRYGSNRSDVRRMLEGLRPAGASVVPLRPDAEDDEAA